MNVSMGADVDDEIDNDDNVTENLENVDPTSISSKGTSSKPSSTPSTRSSSFVSVSSSLAENRKRSSTEALLDEDSPPQRQLSKIIKQSTRSGEESGGIAGMIYAEREKTRDAMAVTTSFNGENYQ